METLHGWYSKTQYNREKPGQSKKQKGERIFYLNEKEETVEITEVKRTNEPSLFKDAIYVGIVTKFSHVVRVNDIS